MSVCYGMIECSGMFDWAFVLTLIAAIVLTLYLFTKRYLAIIFLFVLWLGWLFLTERFLEFLIFHDPIWSILNIIYLIAIISITYLPILKNKKKNNATLFIWVVAVFIIIILVLTGKCYGSSFGGGYSCTLIPGLSCVSLYVNPNGGFNLEVMNGFEKDVTIVDINMIKPDGSKVDCKNFNTPLLIETNGRNTLVFVDCGFKYVEDDFKYFCPNKKYIGNERFKVNIEFRYKMEGDESINSRIGQLIMSVDYID